VPVITKQNRAQVFGPDCVIYAPMTDMAGMRDEDWIPVNAPVVVNTPIGKGVQFNGISQYINIGGRLNRYLDNTLPFTVVARFSRPPGATNYDTIIARRDALNSRYWSAGFYTAGQIIVRIGRGAGGSYQPITSPGTYNDDIMHLMVWKYDGINVQQLYIDNAYIDQTIVAPDSFLSTSDIYVGAMYNDGVPGYYYSGIIDDIIVFNQYLSVADGTYLWQKYIGAA